MQVDSLLSQYGDTASKMGVLLFFTRHPEGKFTMECINFALETQKQNLGESLEALVLQGVVSKLRTRNGVILYSLSPELENRALVATESKKQEGSGLVSHLT